MAWKVNYSKRFQKGYNGAGSELQKKIDDAIRELANSVNPYTLGRPKHGVLKGQWGYDFGQYCRMLYHCEDTGKEKILFLNRVCDHREVYGQ